jgi:hypothetical protein
MMLLLIGYKISAFFVSFIIRADAIVKTRGSDQGSDCCIDSNTS